MPDGDSSASAADAIAGVASTKREFRHRPRGRGCYRVLDLDRSIDFCTNKLDLELTRKVPIGDDATNAFLAVPITPGPEIRPMEPNERIILANEVDLCVQTFGDGADPPSSSSWEGILDGLVGG